MILDGAQPGVIHHRMGGGTAPGAAPSSPNWRANPGRCTVPVVRSLPFEKARGMQRRNAAYADLGPKVDTADHDSERAHPADLEKKTPLNEAFTFADDVLRQGPGDQRPITQPGLINLDFADVKTIMTDAGSALMGIGEGSGEHRRRRRRRRRSRRRSSRRRSRARRGVIFNITAASTCRCTR